MRKVRIAGEMSFYKMRITENVIKFVCSQTSELLNIIVFNRELHNKLFAWKQQAAGTKALLIEGVRRIGKFTRPKILTVFHKNISLHKYKNITYICFEFYHFITSCESLPSRSLNKSLYFSFSSVLRKEF